ncbi:MAG TPA: sugar phosphate isomerase/epimerase family protein [Cyclobacteriaceae bacterium]|nr:sugar phosphate isomerase/epimerase family protein [Cyclobacteriaceae bacterium]
MSLQTGSGRRKFLEQLALLGISAPLASGMLNAKSRVAERYRNSADAQIDAICVFSKHLHFLDYEEMAGVIKEMGFDGIDLTVRPEGHVLPENVERDLPRAVEAAKKAGVTVPAITTSITAVSEPHTEKILATASGLGIKYYRMGWLGYNHEKSLVDNLNGSIPQFRALADMNKKYGIIGDYQNHAGLHIGAPVWDLHRILAKLDPNWIGCQYDIRHATVEGGTCWPLGLELIRPFIHTIDIKDFYWKMVNGKWVDFNSPVGEGMVDFGQYFGMLKKMGVRATISMHFEYPLTDSPDSMLPAKSELDQVKSKMVRDLKSLQGFISGAGIRYK